MKATTWTMAALVATAFLSFTGPADADGNSCTATAEAPCTFHCHGSTAGDTWLVHLFVSGTGLVGGSVECGSVSTSCAGVDGCMAVNNVNYLDGVGYCKAGANAVARCIANQYWH